jgi:uncharacterized protein YjbI with pentapeptide repeats
MRGRGVIRRPLASGVGRPRGTAWQERHHGTGISSRAARTDDGYHLPLPPGCAVSARRLAASPTACGPGPRLERAIVSRAHLEGATLSGADLTGASLWQTRLKGATLQGADLSEAKGPDAGADRCGGRRRTDQASRWADPAHALDDAQRRRRGAGEALMRLLSEVSSGKFDDQGISKTANAAGVSQISGQSWNGSRGFAGGTGRWS